MSESFRHIVVAYDGSAQARVALDRAIDMARTWSSRLTIVTVYQPPIAWTAAPVASPMVGPVIMSPMTPPQPPGEAEKRALNEVLHQAVQSAERRGVSDVRGELLQGHPAEAILSFADQEQVDLVVMGSRGQSTTTRLLLGSVSDAVIHHAHVAVLVVRPPVPG